MREPDMGADESPGYVPVLVVVNNTPFGREKFGAPDQELSLLVLVFGFREIVGIPVYTGKTFGVELPPFPIFQLFRRRRADVVGGTGEYQIHVFDSP